MQSFAIFALVAIHSAVAAPVKASTDYYDMRLQECDSKHTLHGLWPQWAESCSGPAFDVNLLSSIMTEMTTWWPSCQQPNEEFWSHEWEKHGTCSGMDQLTYFKTALTLCQQYTKESGNDFCFAQNDLTPIPCTAAARFGPRAHNSTVVMV